MISSDRQALTILTMSELVKPVSPSELSCEWVARIDPKSKKTKVVTVSSTGRYISPPLDQYCLTRSISGNSPILPPALLRCKASNSVKVRHLKKIRRGDG